MDDFTLNNNRASWIRDKLAQPDKERFIKWMQSQGLHDSSYVATEYTQQIENQSPSPGTFSAELNGECANPFKADIFKQEFGRHLQRKGFFIEPFRKAVHFSAYQRIGQFDPDYDQYRRIDFFWRHRRSELSFNFGSEQTLITNSKHWLEEGCPAFDIERHLTYRNHNGLEAQCLCPLESRRDKLGSPKKFNYKERYEKLKQFSSEALYDISSPFFTIEKTGFKYVNPDDSFNVSGEQNLMSFGGEKTAVNAVVGMREYGPLKKAANSEKKRLLFIYQNRNDANALYRYLKNGLKHFPGLLSYVGIPVALAHPHKGLPYQNVYDLPETIGKFLDEYYPDPLNRDTLAIVIGPFKKYESDEKESGIYWRVKRALLDKGIVSQFVSPDTINNYGVHYSLPNIAIAILAKFGGVPWKLCRKKTNELIVGFNTKLVTGDRYLGSAVFFDNEGRLGGVKGLPANDKTSLIDSLTSAITEYTSQVGMPERLVIHYYKPPRQKEIGNIQMLLRDMELPVPIAIIEVNDSKSKLDICFDVDFEMGMPESGVYTKIGRDEYLLFNNNRYRKNPPRKIDDELPIKLRLSFVDSGGFTVHELISQVYEFSRLNWRGLKQRSVPVTTTYAKTIAEFSSHFDDDIPQNDVAKNIPWFI